jgi:intracellular multiplication protein IcmB
LFDVIERGLYWLTSFGLHADIDAHVQVVAPLDEYSIQTVNQDLMTVIELKGIRQLVGDLEYGKISGNLSAVLSKYMKAGNGRQHSYSIGFRSAPEGAKRRLAETFDPMRKTAERLGAKRFDPVASQVLALAAVCSDESAYLVFNTHVKGLSKQDIERNAEARAAMLSKIAKAAPGSRIDAAISQPSRIPATQVIARHTAAVANLIEDLARDISKGGCCLLVEKLTCAEGLALMRRHTDSSAFPSSWRPRLIGDKSASRVQSMATRKGEASHITPMALSRQLVTEPAQEFFEEIEYARRGKLLYAGLVMEAPPENGSEPFLDLMSRLNRQIPLSTHFEIIPNGEKDVRRADKFYSGMMGAFSDYNKAIKLGWKHLEDMRKEGHYICGMRVVIMTWARDKRLLVDHLSFLKSSIESWGSATATNETGTPALLSYAAAAGFCRRMPAQYMPGPMDEFAKMLPVFSAASVWESGQAVLHTKQGRPYPVGFGTRLQNFWGTAVFAPSGSGKSFFMNQLITGILLSPGLDKLPYLTAIDVGPSLELSLDVVRSMLPPHMASQIVSVRLRNDPEFCINFLDTQHGLDQLTDVDRDFAISVVSAVAPSLGPEGERFIGQVIDAAFRLFGRRSPQQRKWQASLDARVSAALEAIGFPISDETFVWEVVDALFDAGRIEDSAIAQRYAMPRLPDLIKASREKEILDSYGKTPTPSGELLIDVFTRSIQTGQSSYQLISGFTRFDVGNARVVTVNLEEVVSASETEESRLRASVMFLFSRRLGARNYFMRWEEIEKLVPDRYRAYQRARVDDLQQTLKFLLYDELHYCSGIPAMKRQLGTDNRVARKYTMVPILSSQRLGDFPPDVIENTYSYFILGVGSNDSLAGVQNTFGLSNSEASAIASECKGPGTLFGMFKTRKGTTSQILKTTASGMLSWAFNTDQADALLRKRVRQMLGGDLLLALGHLTAAYPGGSFRDSLEIYNRKRGDKTNDDSYIDVFARQVLEADPVRFEMPKAA